MLDFWTHISSHLKKKNVWASLSGFFTFLANKTHFRMGRLENEVNAFSALILKLSHQFPEMGTSATCRVYFAIRYLANSEKISEIVDLKCSGLAVAYCKVSLPLFATFFFI
jgi:hypothetical protein